MSVCLPGCLSFHRKTRKNHDENRKLLYAVKGRHNHRDIEPTPQFHRNSSKQITAKRLYSIIMVIYGSNRNKNVVTIHYWSNVCTLLLGYSVSTSQRRYGTRYGMKTERSADKAGYRIQLRVAQEMKAIQFIFLSPSLCRLQTATHIDFLLILCLFVCYLFQLTMNLGNGSSTRRW